MLTYDEKKAIETAHVLINARKNKKAIFSKCYETPEKRLPPDIKLGSKEHAAWLFYTSLGEVKVKSKVFIQHAYELFQKSPEIFDPSYIAQNFERIGEGKIKNKENGENLEVIIRDDLKHGLYKQIADRWFQNSFIVSRDYNGDVRNILKGVKDVSTAEKILGVVRPGKRKGYDGFRGFGQKTASLFMMRLTEAGLTNFNEYELPLPVDHQLIDLVLGREIVDFDDDYIHRGRFVEFTKEKLATTCKENKISPIKFKNASWILKAELSNNCVKLKNGKDLCPFEEPCMYRLDDYEYNTRGRIVKNVNTI